MSLEDQVLDTCVEILSDPKAWHQGSYYSDDAEAFCAIGIIQQAYTKCGVILDFVSTERSPAAGRVAEAGRAEYPEFMDAERGFRIARWNDDEKRTHAEVLAVFEKARAL